VKPFPYAPPHISIMDPFLSYDHFDEAEEKLKRTVEHIHPFTIRLANWSYFKHGKDSYTLWLQPEVIKHDQGKKNPLVELYKKCSNVFPMCAGTKKATPHVSMGKFTDLDELKFYMEKYTEEWTPIECEIKELYLLSRLGGGKFQVRKVIPLSGVTSEPLYEPCPVPENSYMLRSLKVDALPRTLDDLELLQLFATYKPVSATVKKNKYGISNCWGEVEFRSKEDRINALHDIKVRRLFINEKEIIVKPNH